LVPRKLIRLSEGVEYLQGQFADLSAQAGWSQPHAVRVVALQQLHPALYRYLRQRAARYWRLFDLLRDPWGEPRYSDGASLSTLKASFEKRGGVPAAAMSTSDVVQTAVQTQELENQREKLDLLEVVHYSGAQRGAGDPLELFAHDGAPPTPKDVGLTQQTFSDLYFSATAPPVSEPAPAAMAALPEAEIPNVESAVAALLTSDAISRTEFIERHQLQGKRLPGAVIERLLEELKKPETSSLALDVRWPRDMAQVLSAEQLLGLYDQAGVIAHWVEALPEEIRRWQR
jgi:hypothetical protein